MERGWYPPIFPSTLFSLRLVDLGIFQEAVGSQVGNQTAKIVLGEGEGKLLFSDPS